MKHLRLFTMILLFAGMAAVSPITAFAQSCCDRPGTQCVSGKPAPSNKTQNASGCESTCASPATQATAVSAGPSCASACASACTSTCSAPTGSSACGAPDLILSDPATSIAPRTGPRPEDLGLTDLEPILEPIRAVYRVPGIAAALVKNGELTAIGTAGIRRVGSDERIELNDPFHLGSCGKALTTTVAAIMVDRGMIEWNTTIGDVFPSLEPTMHSLYRSVTLQQLLTHRGGFPARDDTFDKAIAQFTGTIQEQRYALVRYAVADVPAAEPGTQFMYSDIGYSVAGTMLEAVADKPWEELVVSLLAEPVGLSSLGFGAPGLDDPRAVPHGHVLRDDHLVALGVGPGEDLANPAIGPAGTIHMNIADWAKFATFNLSGARHEVTGVLSSDEFAVLHGDPYMQGYALGWFITANPWGDGTALTHTGSCGAWGALVWIMPEQNAALVITTNYGGGSGFRALQLAADQIGDQFLRTKRNAVSVSADGPQ